MKAHLSILLALACALAGCRARVVIGHEAAPTREMPPADAGATSDEPGLDQRDEEMSQEGENSSDGDDDMDELDDDAASDADGED